MHCGGWSVGSQFSNLHCSGWPGGHRIPSFTYSSFSPALASTKGWVLCLADMPGLSHVHAELGRDLPGTASLGRRCQRSGLQRRGPRLWGAQGCSQALPVPPGLLLPKPVFSTGFVLLLPWELSIRECWVGWAGRPGQADGRAVSGPVPGVSREGLVHPTLSTAHPAGPGHVTALGAGRVFPSPLQLAGCPHRAQGSPDAHLFSRSPFASPFPGPPQGGGECLGPDMSPISLWSSWPGAHVTVGRLGGPGRTQSRFRETSSLSHRAHRAEVLV